MSQVAQSKASCCSFISTTILDFCLVDIIDICNANYCRYIVKKIRKLGTGVDILQKSPKMPKEVKILPKPNLDNVLIFQKLSVFFILEIRMLSCLWQ